MYRNVLLVLVVFAIFILALPAIADVDFGGYARSSAMGGAGLAVLDDPLATAMINPAAMALVPRTLAFQFPSLDLRVRGASVSDLWDSRDDVSDTDTQGAISLARKFSRQTTQLDIDLHTGISMGTGAIAYGGQAIAQIAPNQQFINWAKGDNTSANALAARATVSGNAIAFLPSISMGCGVPRPSGKMYIGARGRVISSTHYEQGLRLTDPNDGAIDIVQDGEETKVDDNGFGMDVGMIMCPESLKQASYGLVVTNFIKPSLSGIEQERIISAGFAMKPSDKVLFAADIINITKAYSESPKLRMGIEFKPISKIALRAGYTGDDITYGFGLFGVNVAFSSQTPMSIANTLRF